MINIMVVDDHQLLIDGIKSSLEDCHDLRVVAEANNGKVALEKLEETEVDVVLMDINMPVMDGLECTRLIHKKYPDVKVVALSQYPEKRFVKTMIKNGASGYLLKDASKGELVSAINKVFEGEQYINERLFKDLNFNTFNPNPSPLFPELTKREIEILRLICQEYSSQEISEKLRISFHTVESHRANLMNKGGVKNTAGLVRWAVENEFV